jgi:recombination associated protein RdgC
LFKNLNVYRCETTASAQDMQAALEHARFAECGATEPLSSGWVAPRGQADAALVEAVGGQWLMTLMSERRLLPSAVVKRRVVEMAAQVERESGRKPGKKLRRELKDQAVLQLLPQAFTKRASFKVWLDPLAQRLLIDASSATRADEVVTQLVQAVPALVVKPLHTARSPAALMADWLLNDEQVPAHFSVDRECELKADDEMKAVVRYARHRLDTDEVRQHIRSGKRPTRLALTWQGRVSFVLSDAGQIKKLDFLDVVFENKPARADEHEAFDADAAIATGELVRLLPDLLDALGGEQTPGAEQAAKAPPVRHAAVTAAA